jgi:hypothetical protein
MKVSEVAEEKKRKRTMLGSTGGSSSGAPLKTAWFTGHPWDSRAGLSSFGATASSCSRISSSTTALLPLHSSKEQLGHSSRQR